MLVCEPVDVPKAIAWRVVVAAIFLTGAGRVSLGAPAEDTTRILSVVKRAETETADGPVKSLQGSYLPKFVEDRQPADEVYDVNWASSSDGLPAGCIVRFEYRQAGNDVVHADAHRYETAVQGSSTATFVIRGSAEGAGGPVSAWRVRVLQDKRILANKSSPSWR